MFRLAGQALMPFLKAAIPRTGRGIAADVAPNLLFAGLSAASLPEGSGEGLRAGAFAEDLLTSVPLSWAGRAGGYGIARGIGRMRNQPLSADDFNMIQGVSCGGAEAAAWTLGLVPRPFAGAAFDQYNQRMQDEQLQQQALREMEIRNQTVAELGGAGLLLAPLRQAFSPANSYAPF